MSAHCRRENIELQKFQLISKGILYLEENNASDLSIKEIAAMCNISEIYFRKLFKQYSGVSPMEYKVNIKISNAKKYLTLETLSIKEIAFLSGFNDYAYFCRLFKRKEGITPKQYREKYTTLI